MAVRARLSAPSAHRADWPWHSVQSASVKASDVWSGQRRLEAESFLAEGYAIRCALESKRDQWCRLGELLAASAPPRIKQILVSPQHGIPYLNTSQVFDPVPKPRKWLAASRTTSYEQRLVSQGTILVMASATVGRTVVATRHHENSVISHHFMRVVPKREGDAGWLYAFLRSRPGQSMMRSSQYASIIRHIEPAHLMGIPIPRANDEAKKEFNRVFERIIYLRNRSTELAEQAFDIFESALLPPQPHGQDWAFQVRARQLESRRRRFEAAFYTPAANQILSRFERFEPLSDITHGVWWGKRFKRIPSPSGKPYLSADNLFTINPYTIDRIVVADRIGTDQLLIEPGWIVMACSGQTYGLNGSARILTEHHRDFLLSHDLIRIVPNLDKVRAGYLLTALTHPKVGRPLVVREAYGSSIPHIEPSDLATFPVVRLSPATEDSIADLAEEAAVTLAKAEALERDIIEVATELVENFLKDARPRS